MTPSRLLGYLLALTALLSLLLALWGDSTPHILPILTALLSSMLLLVWPGPLGQVSMTSRVGFHGGTFAFFLSYPMLAPDQLTSTGSGTSRLFAGLALLFSVLGFECGYRARSVVDPSPSPPHNIREAPISKGVLGPLKMVIALGLLSWSITVLDLSFGFGVPLVDLFLTMRGQVEGANPEGGTFLGYLAQVFGVGLFASAAGAVVLLASTRVTPAWRLTALLLLALSAAVGFLRGSRAMFLYGSIPLCSALWQLTSGRQVARLAFAGVACFGVLITWGVQAGARGGDVRRYVPEWNSIRPDSYAGGAFKIYDDLELITDAFPEKIPFQYGRSLIPLLFGWVPRPLWPDKPYPFSMYAMVLRGETLSNRSASIAVGLPGEGYGNFGIPGAFAWAMLLGAAARHGDRHLFRKLHWPMALRHMLMGLVATWCAMMVRGGVPEMFYMGLFPVAMAYLSAWYAFDRRGRAPLPNQLPRTHSKRARG